MLIICLKARFSFKDFQKKNKKTLSKIILKGERLCGSLIRDTINRFLNIIEELSSFMKSCIQLNLYIYIYLNWAKFWTRTEI